MLLTLFLQETSYSRIVNWSFINNISEFEVQMITDLSGPDSVYPFMRI